MVVTNNAVVGLCLFVRHSVTKGSRYFLKISSLRGSEAIECKKMIPESTGPSGQLHMFCRAFLILIFENDIKSVLGSGKPSTD